MSGMYGQRMRAAFLNNEYLIYKILRIVNG